MSFHSLLRSLNHQETSEYDPDLYHSQTETLPLTDEEDLEIIKHCEAHFSGNFDIMLDYYSQEEGKGIMEDFSIERIENLKYTEEEMGLKLSSVLLTPTDLEEVSKAKKAYQHLKSLYEKDLQEDNETLLIGNLIFSEEEFPLEEINAVVAKGKQIVPSLIALLRSDDFKNPLFPGYGQAPSLAAHCLGELKEEQAIPYLFEDIKNDDFFTAQIAIDALRKIGEASKTFLKEHLTNIPFNQDNESAAFALIAFEDPTIASSCLQLLTQLNPKNSPSFFLQLLMNIQYLNSTEEKEQFKEFVNTKSIPENFKMDIDYILNSWK